VIAESWRLLAPRSQGGSCLRVSGCGCAAAGGSLARTGPRVPGRGRGDGLARGAVREGARACGSPDRYRPSITEPVNDLRAVSGAE
jgi:hypothetical protein